MSTKKLLNRVHENVVFSLRSLGIWGALQVKLMDLITRHICAIEKKDYYYHSWCLLVSASTLFFIVLVLYRVHFFLLLGMAFLNCLLKCEAETYLRCCYVFSSSLVVLGLLFCSWRDFYICCLACNSKRHFYSSHI